MPFLPPNQQRQSTEGHNTQLTLTVQKQHQLQTTIARNAKKPAAELNTAEDITNMRKLAVKLSAHLT